MSRKDIQNITLQRSQPKQKKEGSEFLTSEGIKVKSNYLLIKRYHENEFKNILGDHKRFKNRKKRSFDLYHCN